MTKEQFESFVAMQTERDARMETLLKRSEKTSSRTLPAKGFNWPAWAMAIVASTILAVTGYAASNFLGHGNRLTTVETKQLDIQEDVKELKTEQRQGFIDINEKLNIMIGRDGRRSR